MEYYRKDSFDEVKRMKLKIVELTKENEEKYIDQVAELEEVVLESMEKEGKIGQLFITGKEDISEYIKSDNNTVIVGIDDQEQVQSATYITQGQKPFTYNDITKYFKYGEGYQQYAKSKYATKEQYQQEMLIAYEQKIEAYQYAKRRIQEEYPKFHTLTDFLETEVSENGFHEKSILREKWNQYMAEYIEQKGDKQSPIRYERFYWITAQDIAQEMNRTINTQQIEKKEVKEYENWMEQQKEYEQLLKKATLEIHEKPAFPTDKYYTANTNNAVEIDTYLTNPNQRHAGTARILVYEGIKKHIKRHFENPENEEIFLCSTLHRENLSSKYVSEFFGLKDSLYVKRRQGRDREVHICKIQKGEAQKYIEKMQNKLAVLYGYNPENKEIPIEVKKEIIQEQLEYEKTEFKRLNRARHYPCNYKGNVRDLQSKANKIIRLKQQYKELTLPNKGVSVEDEGDR